MGLTGNGALATLLRDTEARARRADRARLDQVRQDIPGGPTRRVLDLGVAEHDHHLAVLAHAPD